MVVFTWRLDLELVVLYLGLDLVLVGLYLGLDSGRRVWTLDPLH